MLHPLRAGVGDVLRAPDGVLVNGSRGNEQRWNDRRERQLRQGLRWAHYTGGAYEAYASGDAYWSNLEHPSFRFEADVFAPYLEPSHRVLDFGCGNSGLMNALRHRVAAIEGLEVNPAAAQRGRDAGFTVYDAIGSIPPGKTYDRIISNHVLEHVRDVCGTLESLAAASGA